MERIITKINPTLKATASEIAGWICFGVITAGKEITFGEANKRF